MAKPIAIPSIIGRNVSVPCAVSGNTFQTVVECTQVLEHTSSRVLAASDRKERGIFSKTARSCIQLMFPYRKIEPFLCVWERAEIARRITPPCRAIRQAQIDEAFRLSVPAAPRKPWAISFAAAAAS